jgi:hypothetical protein
VLYRYIFRGIGIVFVAGMVTALLLAIYAQTHSARSVPSNAPARHTQKNAQEVRP